jgi:hypothetical protein
MTFSGLPRVTCLDAGLAADELFIRNIVDPVK